MTYWVGFALNRWVEVLPKGKIKRLAVLTVGVCGKILEMQ